MRLKSDWVVSMATKQPYLKAKNAWWLRVFLVANTAAFLSVVIAGQLSASSVEHFWQRLSVQHGLIALCFPLATLVLNGVFGDLAKARIVFWRWNDPLPGCRAFSTIIRSDPRVDVARLRKRLGHFPSKTKEQNAAWYRLYRAHAEKATILEAHQAYLLTRDLAAMAAMFAVGFSASGFVILESWKLASLYGTALAAQYLILATSARNYGNRFVANVLVEESQA
jgi:hypothetical protein